MGRFEDAMVRAGKVARDGVQATFSNAVKELERSVVDGSELTGSPGQPVGNYKGGGKLRASWIGAFVSPTEWQLTTDTIYAPWIEAGASPVATYDPARGFPRSERGGYHSRALSLAGWDRIIEKVVQDVNRDIDQALLAAVATPLDDAA